MKTLRVIFLSLVFVVTLHAKFVPTPEMAMGFAMNKDTQKWVPKFMDGDKTGIIFEFVPEGQTIDAWKEMVAQQIAFTPVTLRKHVDDWKAMLLRADPKIEIKEEQKEDGSILVTYTSLAAQEMSMRRFIGAKDGIYMLAYHVRPAFKDEGRVKIWLDIITAAYLRPNPVKKK